MSMNGARLAGGIVPLDVLRDPHDADSDEPGLATEACACGWFTIGTEGAVEAAFLDHRLDACAASLLPANRSWTAIDLSPRPDPDS